MDNRVVNVAIVVYYPDLKILADAVNSALKCQQTALVILIDNGSEERVQSFASSHKCEYIRASSNLGFGRAHNLGIKRFGHKAPYYLILNPDVVIHDGCIEELVKLMDQRTDVFLAAPKVLNPDGSLQRVHKRLPSFRVLMGRRFFPNLFEKIWPDDFAKYELRDCDMDRPHYIPNVSGCFMFFRSQKLIELGGFDERFFMYQEDADLSRRAHLIGRVVYWPKAQITHVWTRGSHKKLKLTLMNIASVLKYFWKWGFDNWSEPSEWTSEEVKNIEAI